MTASIDIAGALFAIVVVVLVLAMMAWGAGLDVRSLFGRRR